MGSNLIHFPAVGRRATRLPRWSQPSDCFEVVESDSQLDAGTLPPGAILVILAGHVWHGYPHAVEFDGQTFVGIIRYTSPDTVTFVSWHEGERSGDYSLHKLKVRGVVCRIEPMGEDAPAWELEPARAVGTGVSNPYLRPVLKASN